MIDLTVEIKNLKFKNPVTVASGTFGSKDEYASFVDYGKLGAVVTKSITYEARRGNPMPRIWETPSGMMNAIGLENKGAEHFCSECLPFFKSVDTPLIVSIAGETVDEYAKLAKRLSQEKIVSALEINVSCPNVERGGMHFLARPELTAEVVRAVRGETGLLLFTKLSPEASPFMEVAEASIKAGSTGLSLINTIKSLAIDVEKRRPQLGSVFGGLSGPAIRPIALRYVYEAKQALSCPCIAMGGILTASDALEFLVAGADLVAVGTGNFVNPKAVIEVIDGIRNYMEKHNIAKIKELRWTGQNA
ncbi:MAG: dihydroorotate dehydrogenase [Candidatus Omnitrophica bacterium]|nr:dihydroorotate dehydrogenase [Candidatus Omnitrophota bacterium]